MNAKEETEIHLIAGGQVGRKGLIPAFLLTACGRFIRKRDCHKMTIVARHTTCGQCKRTVWWKTKTAMEPNIQSSIVNSKSKTES